MKTLLALMFITTDIFACTLAWTPPPEQVDGYRLYVNSNAPIEVPVGNTFPCDGMQGSAYMTAYNAAGEGAASNTVNFISVPSAPGSLTVQY